MEVEDVFETKLNNIPDLDTSDVRNHIVAVKARDGSSTSFSVATCPAPLNVIGVPNEPIT